MENARKYWKRQATAINVFNFNFFDRKIFMILENIV